MLQPGFPTAALYVRSELESNLPSLWLILFVANVACAVTQVDYGRVTLYYPPKLPIGGIWRFNYEVG